MSATGLTIVGTGVGGACLPWCSISSSSQNSLETSGHLGYEFLECWNLVPFLPDYRFPAAEEFVVVFDVFFV